MRAILCNILMLSVLGMSLDGAIDIVRQGHPHNDGPAQQLDELAQVKSTHSDSSPDGNACEHFCHGHVASIVMELPLLSFERAVDRATTQTTRVASLPHAPPTPPPNA